MRLIDADALADALFEQRKNYPQWVANTIGEMPVIDAVQIVRCKDCKKRDSWECWQYFLGRLKIPDDWYCADGERKGSE
jgi:hypothetical protein